MVPQLKAKLCGELLTLEKAIIENKSVVEHWFRDMFLQFKPPFYSSVDLRNSCFKIAPVDTNLFPAGFNNIGTNDRRCAIQAFMAAIERNCPHAETVLIIPESHTRNDFYHQSVGQLCNMLSNVGLTVILGSMDDEFCKLKKLFFKTPEGLPSYLPIERISFDDDKIIVNGIKPDLVVLNNDFSSGIPYNLKLVNETQRILPPLKASWATRKKSNHFNLYSEVAKDFCKLFSADDWLINPITKKCSNVNFKEKEGEDCLSDNISEVLKKIKAKYDRYGIEKSPFAVVKADSGTYGMSVMTVRDPNEIYKMNNKQRKKMAKNKEGVLVESVLIQEGVYSFETVIDANLSSVAEPVVYLVDNFVVGGFYRLHAKRGLDENLNAPGMKFFPLPFEDSCQLPSLSSDPESVTNRLYFYGVIARLAALSAAKENYVK